MPEQPPPTRAGTTHARTAAEQARRRLALPAGGHGSVWHPWEETMKLAQETMRAEVAEALRDLDAAMAATSRILEVAEASAGEAAGQIERAAWAAWHAQMNEAGKVREAIIGPARTAYEQAIERAHAEFDRAVTTAESAYKAETAAAGRAKASVAGMTA